MKNIKAKLIAAILVVLVLGVYYYAALPAINIHAAEFWVFLVILIILAAILFIRKKNLSRYELRESKGLKVILGILAVSRHVTPSIGLDSLVLKPLGALILSLGGVELMKHLCPILRLGGELFTLVLSICLMAAVYFLLMILAGIRKIFHL